MANQNNRTVAITAIVVIALLIIGYIAYVTPGSPFYPGTSNGSSSSSSVSSVRSVSSSSSSEDDSSDSSSSEDDASSVSSVSSRSSSVMTGTGSSSSFAQTSPRETVSHFYLLAATHNGDVVADVAAGSPFLTSSFRGSLTDDAQLFCSTRQPLNFSTVLVSRTDSNATVQVNERYADASMNTTVTVSVVNEDGTWRIDGVTCGTSSSSSSL